MSKISARGLSRADHAQDLLVHHHSPAAGRRDGRFRWHRGSRPVGRFGFHFGAAFQIRDDLLNLVGDEQTYGKEILGDLYEGKRTLTLVHLMATAGGETVPGQRLPAAQPRRRSDELVRTCAR